MEPDKEPTVNPKDVRFCQDNIGDRFQNGPNLLAVFIKLWDKKLDPINMQGRIQVFDMTPAEKQAIIDYRQNHELGPTYLDDNMKYAVEGNRRLYLYRKLAEAGKINNVPYKVLNFLDNNQRKKFTTRNSGKRIKLRSNIKGKKNPIQQRIEDIVKRGEVLPDDRKFAEHYGGNQMFACGGVLLKSGSEMAYGNDGEDDEDEVYYESDDDGL